MTECDTLLAEANARPFTGWDFAWLGARMTVDRPWDYTQMVVELARASPDLLDMGTGGGEWLAELPERPARTFATEAWPPNVALAARNLATARVAVVRDEGAADNECQGHDDPKGRLPFRTGAFTLVVNRHEAFVADEVARVLADGGVFVTQQVDDGNLDDCFGLLDAGVPERRASWLSLAIDQLAATGLEIEDARAGVERYRFADVGALAWYLKAVTPLHPEWADFRIDRHRQAFARIHEGLGAGDVVTLRQKRILVRARRTAASPRRM